MGIKSLFMEKYFKLVLLFSFTLFIGSCKKSTEEGRYFKWSYKGSSYTATITYASAIEDAGANIIGGLGSSRLSPGSGPFFKIIPLKKGLFALGGSENYAGFIDTDGNILPVSGIITITSVANKKLSGTFIMEVGNTGDQHTLQGEIKNIPISN